MPNVAGCVVSGVFVVCSSLDIFTFVRTSPNITVASFPLIASTVPTVVSPRIRTLSPTQKVCCSANADGVGSLVPIVVGLPAFSFFSFFRFSRRSLRSIICRIFFSIRSSADLVSISLTSSLNAFSSSRSRFVSSFSAWHSRISRIVFSILRLLSFSSSCACSLACRNISLRFCASSFISSSYFAIVFSRSFSR